MNIFTCFYTSLNIDHLRCGAQLRSTILDRTPIVAFARPKCFFVFFSSRVCFSFCWLPLESSQLEVIYLVVNCLLFIINIFIIVTTVTMIISIVTTLTKISIVSNKIFTWRSVRQASPGTLAGWSLSTSLANCKTSRSHWSKLYIPFVGI